MRLVAALLSLAALFFGSACNSTVAGNPPPGYSLRTPQKTTEYFAWAVENDSAAHAYACLGREFIDRHDLSPGKLDFAFSRVQEEIARYIGEVENLEIVDQEVIDDKTRRVFFESGPRTATVIFTKETSWDVDFLSARRESQGALVENLDDLLETNADANELVVRLPLTDASDITPDDIYLIRVRGQWKLARIENDNLDDLDRELP